MWGNGGRGGGQGHGGCVCVCVCVGGSLAVAILKMSLVSVSGEMVDHKYSKVGLLARIRLHRLAAARSLEFLYTLFCLFFFPPFRFSLIHSKQTDRPFDFFFFF